MHQFKYPNRDQQSEAIPLSEAIPTGLHYLNYKAEEALKLYHLYTCTFTLVI